MTALAVLTVLAVLENNLALLLLVLRNKGQRGNCDGFSGSDGCGRDDYPP